MAVFPQLRTSNVLKHTFRKQREVFVEIISLDNFIRKAFSHFLPKDAIMFRYFQNICCSLNSKLTNYTMVAANIILAVVQH